MNHVTLLRFFQYVSCHGLSEKAHYVCHIQFTLFGNLLKSGFPIDRYVVDDSVPIDVLKTKKEILLRLSTKVMQQMGRNSHTSPGASSITPRGPRRR